MFDFGFTELLVIGVIALVVLGPERMPEVARLAGRWFARAQGYITQVKAEFERETQLSEIQQIRDEIRSGAAAVRHSVESVNHSLQDQTQQLNKVLTPTSPQEPVAGDVAAEPPQEQEELYDEQKAQSYAKDFARSNPFGWDMPDQTSWESQYVPRRYKAMAGLDELVGEVQELREHMAISGKPLRGNNRRYAVRSRTNRARIYR